MTEFDKRVFAAAIMAVGAVMAAGVGWSKTHTAESGQPDWEVLVVEYFDKIRGRLEEMKIY